MKYVTEVIHLQYAYVLLILFAVKKQAKKLKFVNIFSIYQITS
jgi:hypothetical protein